MDLDAYGLSLEDMEEIMGAPPPPPPPHPGTTPRHHTQAPAPGRRQAPIRAAHPPAAGSYEKQVPQNPLVEGLPTTQEPVAVHTIPRGGGGENPLVDFLPALIAEHRVLLKAAGYSDYRGHGSVHKYSSYLANIVRVAEFKSRGDLFESEAWARAKAACVSIAFAAAATNTTKPDKLHSNYMRGFTTFVRFARP